MTKEELHELLVVQNLSYEEVGRREGVTGNAIKKRAKRAGIFLERSKYTGWNKEKPRSEKLSKDCMNCGKTFYAQDKNHYKAQKYCCSQCKSDYEYKQYIQKWKSGEVSGTNKKIVYNLPNPIRRYMLNESENKCSQCGWGEVNPATGKSPLHIDHIDGDCSNNRPENLRVLCPNCHSLTDTYGILNKGNGRYTRSGHKHPKDR